MKTTEKQQNRNFLVVNASVIIMLILMACSSVIFAQPPGGQQGPPKLPSSKQIKKMVAEIAEEISLDDEQETQVLTLYQGHFKEVEEATSNGRPDRTKMEALKTELETDVKALLSKEQQEEYTAYVKKNSQQKRGGQSPPR